VTSHTEARATLEGAKPITGDGGYESQRTCRHLADVHPSCRAYWLVGPLPAKSRLGAADSGPTGFRWYGRCSGSCGNGDVWRRCRTCRPRASQTTIPIGTRKQSAIGFWTGSLRGSLSGTPSSISRPGSGELVPRKNYQVLVLALPGDVMDRFGGTSSGATRGRSSCSAKTGHGRRRSTHMPRCSWPSRRRSGFASSGTTRSDATPSPPRPSRAGTRSRPSRSSWATARPRAPTATPILEVGRSFGSWRRSGQPRHRMSTTHQLGRDDEGGHAG